MRYLIMAIRTPAFQQSVVEPHKEYLAKLNAQGVLELSGGFTDKTGGAYLITAKDLASAKEVANNDPIHITGASVLTVYEWDVKSPE